MAQVSYALREDPNSIVLLQDAGRYYDRYCQIAMFGKNIIRPDFFRQYLYFAPFTGANGKYRGTVTDVQISIEDNEFVPRNDYVAIIDSEVEFKVTPSVIHQLSCDYMPAWGMKSYLDYFSDRKSGILLFLRVYKVKQEVSPSYLEKGIRGSSQILKLYDEQGEEVTLPVDVIEPVISANKFSYLKDEILHLLKVENALIALYDDTEKGLNSLQERVIADRLLQGTKERWKDRHLQWLGKMSEDDDFDMAQLDYDAIYQEVLQINPEMTGIIEYTRGIQAARLGEYDYCLKDIHDKSNKYSVSFTRLFEMSLRAAVKNALYYYKKNNIDFDDAFQEACLGIIMAIQKHNDNVAGLFPSYASMWMLQVMRRDLSPFLNNVYVPAHYISRIENVLNQLPNVIKRSDILETDYNDLVNLLMDYTDCDEREAHHIASIISPSESIEEIVGDNLKENYLSDPIPIDERVQERIDEEIVLRKIDEILKTLNPRQERVLKLRFGLEDGKARTLEEVGIELKLTRERIRQIEKAALRRIKKSLCMEEMKLYVDKNRQKACDNK